MGLAVRSRGGGTTGYACWPHPYRLFGQVRTRDAGPGARIASVTIAALRVIFDYYLVREGVNSLLADVEGIDVVAAAADLDSLLRAVPRTRRTLC